jgi:hypothetical protein
MFCGIRPRVLFTLCLSLACFGRAEAVSFGISPPGIHADHLLRGAVHNTEASAWALQVRWPERIDLERAWINRTRLFLDCGQIMFSEAVLDPLP